jgi:hypothetical protein
MIRLDKEIVVLLGSFFTLCVVAAILTANSSSIISAIRDSTDLTSLEKLQQLLTNGSLPKCMIENQTDVSPSPTNLGIDHILTARCLE